MDVRRLLRQAVFGALEVLPAWPVSLQDAYADTIFRSCKAAAWAADPSQIIGLLDAARLASLHLLAVIQAQGAGSPSAEHELSMTLSPDKFRAFRDALAAMGRIFRDLVMVGADSAGVGCCQLGLQRPGLKVFQELAAHAAA